MKAQEITKINKQIRREMKGQEVLSLDYEGVVLVNENYKVISKGVIIDTLNTNEKINKLWWYYCEQEGINKELKELLK